MTFDPRPALFAAATLGTLAPAAAWAHGDHEGVHGFVHVLTEPAHLGGLLLLGLSALVLGRRVAARLRARAARRVRRD